LSLDAHILYRPFIGLLTSPPFELTTLRFSPPPRWKPPLNPVCQRSFFSAFFAGRTKWNCGNPSPLLSSFPAWGVRCLLISACWGFRVIEGSFFSLSIPTFFLFTIISIPDSVTLGFCRNVGPPHLSPTLGKYFQFLLSAGGALLSDFRFLFFHSMIRNKRPDATFTDHQCGCVSEGFFVLLPLISRHDLFSFCQLLPSSVFSFRGDPSSTRILPVRLFFLFYPPFFYENPLGPPPVSPSYA